MANRRHNPRHESGEIVITSSGDFLHLFLYFAMIFFKIALGGVTLNIMVLLVHGIFGTYNSFKIMEQLYSLAMICLLGFMIHMVRLMAGS